MKAVPISTLKPGTLCHFIDTLPGGEKRINYYRVVKNRKPRISQIMKGVLVVPIMTFGYEQGEKRTFKPKRPGHYWIDGRVPVVKRTTRNWKPKTKVRQLPSFKH